MLAEVIHSMRRLNIVVFSLSRQLVLLFQSVNFEHLRTPSAAHPNREASQEHRYDRKAQAHPGYTEESVVDRVVSFELRGAVLFSRCSRVNNFGFCSYALCFDCQTERLCVYCFCQNLFIMETCVCP